MTKNYKIYFNIFFLLFVVIFLLNSKILSNFVWTYPSLFADFKMPINWLECHKLGIDLFTLEKIDCGTKHKISQFNYGI